MVVPRAGGSTLPQRPNGCFSGGLPRALCDGRLAIANPHVLDNEHGRRFSNCRNRLKINGDEFAKRRHVLDPHAKQVVDVPCDKQAFRDLRSSPYRLQELSMTIGALPSKSHGNNNADA